MSEIKVVHAFSGVDSQLMAEKRVWGDRVKVLATMEVDVDAIISCGAIHENAKFTEFLNYEFAPEQWDYAKQWLKERNIGYDFVAGKSKIDRMKKEKLKHLFIASRITNNLGDISLANKVKMEEEVDIFTYSFPCTDVSLAGRQDGLSKGSGTRSGLLWECERFIDVNKPKVLLMENVKNLVQKKFINEFNEWCSVLEELGYKNYWKVLNAKNHGIPQNRERVFMVSIRKDVDCGYEFPEGFPLQTRLKDVLEKEIDPKYYLSDEIVARFKAKMPSISFDIKIVGSTAPESKRIGGIFDDEKGRHQAGSIWDKEYLAPTIDTCQGGYRMPCIVDDIETKWKEFGNTGYMVSSEGVIKNKDGSIKSQRADKDGYLRANLIVDGTGKTIRSHRLVATVFIENPKNLETVNHKDGNILNNSVSNLEWCSIEDNLKHRAEVLRTGGMKPNQPKGVHFNKDRNLWEVSMKIENKTTYLGRFKTKEDGYECYYYKFIEIKGYEPWNEEEYKAFTYRQSCIIADGEATPNSQTRRGRVGTQIANTLMTSCNQGVVTDYRIRKLTPKECWNLMDFDADAFDKVRPYLSDSALYKQAGNSIVVACMEHIFKNLDIDKIKGGNICNIESQLTSTNSKVNSDAV